MRIERTTRPLLCVEPLYYGRSVRMVVGMSREDEEVKKMWKVKVVLILSKESLSGICGNVQTNLPDGVLLLFPLEQQRT